MASKKARQTGYRNSGSKINCNSRDASACVSPDWASRSSPSGTNTNSRGAVGFGDAALGGARGEFDVDWGEGVVSFEPRA